MKYLKSYKSFDIKIPQIILDSESKVINEYVRTFYDDEGCASLRLNKKTKEWKRNITLSSNSYEILSQIKNILLEQDIRTNKIIRNRANSDYDQSFVLSVTGQKNFIKFQQKIGFKHPRKIKMLQLIIDSYGSTSKYKEMFEMLNLKLEKISIKKRKVDS